MDVQKGCPSEKTLMDFVAECLDAAATTAVQTHLADCPRCSQIAAWIQTHWLHGEDEDQSHWPTLAVQGGLPRGSGPETVEWSILKEEGLDASILEPSAQTGALGRLGKYDLLDLLGRGGMGIVFKGFDEALCRTVAVKVLNRQFAYSSTARRRFLREARAAAGISHPNVVTIYAVDDHKDFPFLVMEYVGGGSLRDYIRRHSGLDPLEALRLAREIAAGLAAAHAHGVIHRDVKPGNILLEEGAVRVKIGDFGLARVAVDNVDLTSHAIAVGTPAYMSPEQVSGARLDARSDLFGMGCVIYAMIVGRSPFHGKHPLEMARKVAEYEVPPLESVQPGTPHFLSETVERLLKKSPDDRFQSAAEVADLLDRHLAALNQTPTDEIRALFAAGAWPRKSRRRHTAGAVVLALILVGMIALVAGSVLPWFGRGPALPGQDGSAGIADREISGGVIRVAQDGSADVRSIGEALLAPGPDTVIRVVDYETYAESLHVLGQRGLHLEGPQPSPSGDRCTLRSADSASPVLQIRDTSEVVVQDFRIEASAASAIVITGACAGVLIQRVQTRHPDDPGVSPPAIRVEASRPEGSDAPIVVCDCVLDHAPRGQCLFVVGTVARSADFQLRRTRLLGRGVQILVSAPEGRPLGRVAIEENLFLGSLERSVGEGVARPSLNGINLDLRVSGPQQDVRIHNNTFLNVRYWVGLAHSTISAPGVSVCNNLILGSDGVEGSPDRIDAAARWWRFAANFWEPYEPTSAESALGQDLWPTFATASSLSSATTPTIRSSSVRRPVRRLRRRGTAGTD